MVGGERVYGTSDTTVDELLVDKDTVSRSSTNVHQTMDASISPVGDKGADDAPRGDIPKVGKVDRSDSEEGDIDDDTFETEDGVPLGNVPPAALTGDRTVLFPPSSALRITEELADDGAEVKNLLASHTTMLAPPSTGLNRGRSFGTNLMRLVSSLPRINSAKDISTAQGSSEPSDAEPNVSSDTTKAAPSGQLVLDEGRESGSVKLSVYVEYARYIGFAVSLVLWAAMIGGQGAYLASDLWLAFWSRSSPGSQGDDRSELNICDNGSTILISS